MVYSTDKKLRISDTDFCGNIKFSALMSVMQEAADEQSALYGINNDSMSAKGLAWILTRMAVKKRDIRQSADFTISTCALPAKGIEFPREYVLTDKDGAEIAYGIGMWSVIDLKERRLTRAGSVDGYADMLGGAAQKYEFNKVRLSLADGFERAGCHTVLNTEIDMLGHLNNIYYADIAVNALSREEFSTGYKEINISYKREARLAEVIEIYKRTGDGAAEIIGMLNGEQCFAAMLKL